MLCQYFSIRLSAVNDTGSWWKHIFSRFLDYTRMIPGKQASMRIGGNDIDIALVDNFDFSWFELLPSNTIFVHKQMLTDKHQPAWSSSKSLFWFQRDSDCVPAHQTLENLVYSTTFCKFFILKCIMMVYILYEALPKLKLLFVSWKLNLTSTAISFCSAVCLHLRQRWRSQVLEKRYSRGPPGIQFSVSRLLSLASKS